MMVISKLDELVKFLKDLQLPSWVTGMPGSGKSFCCAVAKQVGLKAFDTDEIGVTVEKSKKGQVFKNVPWIIDTGSIPDGEVLLVGTCNNELDLMKSVKFRNVVFLSTEHKLFVEIMRQKSELENLTPQYVEEFKKRSQWTQQQYEEAVAYHASILQKVCTAFGFRFHNLKLMQLPGIPTVGWTDDTVKQAIKKVLSSKNTISVEEAPEENVEPKTSEDEKAQD